ncbi:hypothetical protein [Rhizobium sp. CC-YZS058]|uniref:hypothetical protein n=1 Tax=Rhizobium sp. CC-YZS058 TaxID=3042153 RepID=UPI002B05352D|nr:hypothetical protein [Rhizobium sp. CC-YZS058]MEA3535248.1 hypothetical protein [Rhizobium sp. CC-YZS058]
MDAMNAADLANAPSERLQACMDALRPAFESAVESGGVALGSAAGSELPNELETLASEAERAGWPADLARRAIHELAREGLGAEGAVYD